MEDNEFPTSYKAPSGWKGMDVEVLEELVKRTQLDYKIIDIPFKRSMSEIEKGQIDLISNLSKNAERNEFLNWIGPVRNTKIGFVVLEKNLNLPISNLAELIAILDTKRQQIGYLIGASYSPLIDAIVENDKTFRQHLWFTARRELYVHMLQRDRLFGFFLDEFEASSLINANKNGPVNDFYGFAVHNYSIDDSVAGAYFGVSKTLDPQIYQQLSQAFNDMQNDGALETIFKKWSGNAPEKNN